MLLKEIRDIKQTETAWIKCPLVPGGNLGTICSINPPYLGGERRPGVTSPSRWLHLHRELLLSIVVRINAFILQSHWHVDECCVSFPEEPFCCPGVSTIIHCEVSECDLYRYAKKLFMLWHSSKTPNTPLMSGCFWTESPGTVHLMLPSNPVKWLRKDL